METWKVIKEDKETYSDIVWLKAATSNKEYKEVFQFIAKKGDSLIATDGIRMHQVKTEQDWPDGLYEVEKIKTGFLVMLQEAYDPGDFPNTDTVIPTEAADRQIEILAVKDEYFRNVAKIARLLPEGVAINLDYLKDAIGNGGDSMTVSVYSSQKPIKFENERRVALIMPLFKE